MAITLQIVDIDDPTSILFDLNDSTGANSALYGSVITGILQDVDMGSPVMPNLGTGITGSFNRDARAPLKMRVRIHGSTYDAQALAVGRLAQYIAQGCCIKYTANGSTDVRYIDCDPSDAPVLLNGQPTALFQAMTMMDTPEGITLQLSRLPYLRGDKLDPTVNKLVSNPTLLRDSNADGLPDGWTKEGTPTLTISASQESLHAVAASATHGVSQLTATGSAAPGQIWTVSVDVKVTSGTFEVNLQWLTSVGGNISFITLTQGVTGWKRIQLSGTAPATTDHINMYLRASGGASTFDVRNAQAEIASAASPFRVVAQTINVDPVATPFAQYLPVYNPSTAPSPCQIELAFPDASTAGVEVDYAMRSNYGIQGRNRLADFLNGPNFAQAESTGNGWTVTLVTGTTSTADANASGGNMARTIHATDPNTLTKRIAWTRSTVLDCLRGRFTVYARLKGAAARIYDLQLNWSAGASALISNDVAQHDTTALANGATTAYVYISLGEIELPEELNIALGNLTFELWTCIDSGTATNLDVDHLTLVPANDVAFATMPSGPILSANGNTMTTPPAKLTADPVWVAGSQPPGYSFAILDAGAFRAAGPGSNTNGWFLGSGNVHITTFVVAGLFAGTWKYGIANITDGDTLDATGADTQATVTNGPYGTKTYTVVWTDENADKYQPRVGITASTSGSLTLFSITDQIIPAVIQNQKVRADSGSLPTRSDVEKLDSSGNMVIPLAVTNMPFWLPPGLSLIYLNEFDVASIGYQENQSTLVRTMTATPTVYPRFYS